MPSLSTPFLIILISKGCFFWNSIFILLSFFFFKNFYYSMYNIFLGHFCVLSCLWFMFFSPKLGGLGNFCICQRLGNLKMVINRYTFVCILCTRNGSLHYISFKGVPLGRVQGMRSHPSARGTIASVHFKKTPFAPVGFPKTFRKIRKLDSFWLN